MRGLRDLEKDGRVNLGKSSNGRLGPILLTAAVVVAAVSVPLVRSAVESRHYLELAEVAADSGRWDESILHYRHAVEWYAPLISVSDTAFESLLAIGDERAQSGDIKTALFAFRSARVGAMATRHLWSPYGSSLTDLHRRIASLAAREGSRGRQIDESEYLDRLEGYEDRLPSPLRGFLTGAVFVFWLGSLVLATVLGFDRQGKPRRALAWWAPASVCLLAAWLLLLRWV